MENNANDTMSSMRKDVLSEIGNIGFGNATTAMSSILGSKLSIDFTQVLALDFDAVMDLLGGPEMLAVGVLILFEGDLDGMLLFILGKEQADKIVNQLLQSSDEVKEYEYSHIQASAMKETGNIIGSSYLAALESFTGLHLKLLPPQICVDMSGAILSVPVIEFGQTGDKAFLVKSSFDDAELDIKGHLLMVSSADSYDKMFNVLGIEA